MKTTPLFVVASVMCAVLCATLNAQTLYKSVGPDGKILYSDKPPSAGKLEKTIDVLTLPNTALPPDTIKELDRLKKEGKATLLPDTGVILFSASWCGYCRQAKAHLAQRGITYRDFDIDTPEGKATFAQVAGVGGVPLLIKNGERVRGYSRSAYEVLFARR